jgi:hypothetical protein
LGPLGTAATNRPIVPAPGDYDDGQIGRMMIDRGNRSTRRKPAPVPLCPPQTHMLCPDANPGRRGGTPATNRMSYGTAIIKIKHVRLFPNFTTFFNLVLPCVACYTPQEFNFCSFNSCFLFFIVQISDLYVSLGTARAL